MHKRNEAHQDLHIQVPRTLYETLVSLHPAYGERTEIIRKLLKAYIEHRRANKSSREAA